MAFPIPAHAPYQWQNVPSTQTPLDAVHLALAENDLVSYTQSVIQSYDAYAGTQYVAKNTVTYNAADYGLALNGTDDGPALNVLISTLSASLGADQQAVITIPSKSVLGLGTTVTRASNVHIRGEGATAKVLSTSGPVFTNSTAAPLVNSDLVFAMVDKGNLAGTLFDTHSMQWCRILVTTMINGTSSGTNLTMYCDATTSVDGDAKANSVGNVVSYYDRGVCSTNALLSGLATGAFSGATGPAVITLNEFRNVQARGVYGVAWDLVQWCDDNFWTGMCSNEIKANNAIVVRCNNSASPSTAAGVYCNQFAYLTAENYGAFSASGIVLNYQRGLIVRNYFADPGFGSGTAVVNNNSQSHMIERIGYPSSNNIYTYQQNHYSAYDESATTNPAVVSLLKSRAGGIVNALDYAGKVQYNANLTAGETPVAELRALVTNTSSGSEKCEFRVGTISSGSFAERFRFSDDGRLGIGTPSFAGLPAGLLACTPAAATPAIRGIGFSGQSADLLQLYDSTQATKYFSVGATGAVTGNGSTSLLSNFRRQMRKGTTSNVTPNATLNVYGTPIVFSPASGFYGLEVAQIRVTSAGTFGSETLSVQLIFTFSDASTQTDTKTFTASGVSSDIANGEVNLYAYKDAVSLVSVTIQCASTINNSTAAANMTVAAVNT